MMDVSKWLCVVLAALQCVHSEDIERRLCINIPIKLAVTGVLCSFTLKKARTSLQARYCPSPCVVSISDLYHWRYKVSELVLKFRNQEHRISMKTVCPFDYFWDENKEYEFEKRKLTVECNIESPGNVPLGGPCSLNEQCTGSLHSEMCQGGRCGCRAGYTSYKQTCYPESFFDHMCFSSNKTCKDMTKKCRITEDKDIGVCVCKSEYLGFGGKCLKGNLKINNTCERDEQCSVEPNSECRNGTCMCRDGYTVVNETDCKLLENDEITERNKLRQEQANGVGATVGAVTGGFFLGVLLSTLAVFFIYRRQKDQKQKREETNVTFDRNAIHLPSTTEGSLIHSPQNTEQNSQRKVVNVPPYAPSMESPTYSNVLEAKTSQMKKDDVYSHLHEKENQETENVYNHASSSSDQTMEDDYGHLNAGRGNDRVVLPEDDEYAHTGAVNNDNYFILENQSEI